MRKHNDKDDPFHLKLFEFCVIGHEFDAADDIVHINFSFLWMLSNALRAINAGWVFQLNGDVTGNVCRAGIDLLELSVSSIPAQNNVLCISTIPHATESQRTCEITWDDLRAAVLLSLSIKHCGNDSCECCATMAELIQHPEVVHFTTTTDYAEGRLPVHTAMCDNFKGWGNFAIDSLGIETNLCHPHATGKCCLRSVLFYRI